MPVSYSAAAAAAAVGLNKTIVFRAIHAGFLSATKNKLNEWQVDPAELDEFCRRYAPVAGHSDVIDSARPNALLIGPYDLARRAEAIRSKAQYNEVAQAGHSDVVGSAGPNAVLIDPHDLARRAEAIRSKGRFNEITQAKRLSGLARSDQKAQQDARADWWRLVRALESRTIRTGAATTIPGVAHSERIP
jgi:hypothetical protein